MKRLTLSEFRDRLKTILQDDPEIKPPVYRWTEADGRIRLLRAWTGSDYLQGQDLPRHTEGR